MATICFAVVVCSATIFLKILFIQLESQWICTGWPSYLCTPYSTLYDRPDATEPAGTQDSIFRSLLFSFSMPAMYCEGLLYLQMNQKNVFVQKLKLGSVKVKEIEGCNPIQL